MNKTIISTLAIATIIASATASAQTTVNEQPLIVDPSYNYSLLVYGASMHMDKFGHIDNRTFRSTGNRELNGINPGIGIEAERSGWLVGAGTYKDSFYKQGYMAYGGYRFTFGDMKGWNANVAIKAGYLHGSNRHGLMALPTVGVGYKNVSLEFSAFPYHTDDKGGKGVVIATWLRYTF